MVLLNSRLVLPNYPVEAVGEAGPAGEDGKTSYVHIAYSNSEDGTVDFSTTDPKGRSYLGTYTDFEMLDSNTPSDYKWSKIEGEKGEQGAQGEQGENGLNGDGQLLFNNMFLDYPISGGTDINRETRGWSYSSANLYGMLEGESDAPTYRIMQVGGSTSTTQYLYSKNIPVTSGTRVTIKGQIRGNYDGTNTTVAVLSLRFFELASKPSDNAQSATKGGNSYCNVRPNGTMSTGAGVGSGNATIQMAPMVANVWSDFTIDVLIPDGVSFMKVCNYNGNSDASTIHEFRRETVIAYQKGDKGDKGIAGEKGEDGRTSYVHIAYADDVNGAGFSFNPTNKEYTGMYTDFTETSSTDPTKYKWQLTKGIKGDQGIAGQAGEDGRTPYFHTAWANSSDGTFEFSTTDSLNKSYLGTYTDFEINDSTDPSKYNWTELVGALVVDSVNYALESRFDNLSISGGTGNYRRKQIELSSELHQDSKVQFSFNWKNIVGDNPTKITVVMWHATLGQASEMYTVDVSASSGYIEGSTKLTKNATHMYVYMNGYAQPSANELQLEYIVVNRGDKLNSWLPSPKDRVELNNMLFNSTFNLEWNGWTYSNRYELLEADPDKPNSNILHGIPNTATTQQIGSNPYIPVKKGMLIHVSFDYSENSLGTSEADVLFAVRNLPTADTPQSSANSQEQWYYRRRDLPTQNIVNKFTRFDFYCRVTFDGFLCMIPYDSSGTGTHHSYYREIMVSAGGSLQGDWSPSYSDSQFQLDQNSEETKAIPRIYTQATSPTGDLRNGDVWYKMSNNIVLGVYVYGNNKWNEQAYDSQVIATNIIGKTIQGSEFINTWDSLDGTTQSQGSTVLKEGYIRQVNTTFIDAPTAPKKQSEQTTTIQRGVITNTNVNYEPETGSVLGNSQAVYADGGLNYTSYNSTGQLTSTVQMDGSHFKISDPILETSVELQGGRVLVNEHTPTKMFFGQGSEEQSLTYNNALLPLGTAPNASLPYLGWGMSLADNVIRVVTPQILQVTRDCVLYINTAIRLQGVSANQYLYAHIRRSSTQGGLSGGTGLISTNQFYGFPQDTAKSGREVATGAVLVPFNKNDYLAVTLEGRATATVDFIRVMSMSIEEIFTP